MQMFRTLLVLGAASLTAPLLAQVPQMISLQSRVLSNGTNFHGNGSFKFALVNGPGNVTYWSNDGSSAGGSQPTAAVSLPVADGLVSTLLGDASLANMTAIPPSVFGNSDVRLRIWFNGGSGFQQLTPDQRIVSVGYAMMAHTVPDGSITAPKLANNSVTAAQIANGSIGSIALAANSVNTTHIVDGQVMTADLANNAVTSAKVADGSLLGADLATGTVGTAQLAGSIALGATNVTGRLDVYRTSAGTPGVTLLGSSSQISTYGSDGLEQIRLWGGSYGELLLNNSLSNNATAVRLTAQGSTGGQLELRNTNGLSRAILEGENSGGRLTLYEADGNTGAVLYGNSGSGHGALNLRATNGNSKVWLDGGPSAGTLTLYQADGNTGAVLYGNEGSTQGGALSLRKADGNAGLRAYGGSTAGSFQLLNRLNNISLNLWNTDNEEGVVSVRNSAGAETVYLWGRDSTGSGHGQIGLKRSDGTETITIQASEFNAGGQILLYNSNRTVNTIQLDAQVGSTGGGYLDLKKADGTTSIVLTADDGSVQGQVIEITGGSDFSEKFDIQGASVEPGSIVSIDSENPGQLTRCTTAHDKKVAGIISGAGGVKPGMLMGQRGSIADGQHPVALSGRVYCWADADANGSIEPGDMLTTSGTPGHGMKVTDHATAAGSIVGKAMTSLASGKGLVLVLVNLQ